MSFQPVIMIAPQDRTPVDQAAIRVVHSLQADVRETMNTERSAQKKIGLSEIGDPCDKCVARKLSRLYDDLPDNPSWRAQVGTFIHAGLEDFFVTKYADRQILQANGLGANRPTDDRPFYANERRVKAWEYKGVVYDGSCDLFIQGETYGIVDDWKTQGTKKLSTKTAKGDIGPTYNVQMMLYGLGYENLGLKVTHVLLYALPRDGDLDDAKPVLMRYDRQVALDALARIKNMIDAAEIVGWETIIETRTAAGHCFGCKDFAMAEEQAFHEGLFGNTQ